MCASQKVRTLHYHLYICNWKKGNEKKFGHWSWKPYLNLPRIYFLLPFNIITTTLLFLKRSVATKSNLIRTCMAQTNNLLMRLKTWKSWQYPLLCTLEDEVLKTPTRDLPEDVCSKTKFHSAVELQNVWHHHSYILFFTSYLKIVDNFSFSP